MAETFWVAGNQPIGRVLKDAAVVLAARPRARVINLHEGFRGVQAGFEHLFHRDIFSQEQEKAYWEPAYDMALTTLAHCGADGLTRCSFHGLHHDVASLFMLHFIHGACLEAFPGEDLLLILPVERQSLEKFRSIWDIPPALLREATTHLRPEEAPSPATEALARFCDRSTVMVCYDDSGSGVNSTVAEALILGLRRRGFKVLILSLVGRPSPFPEDIGVLACPVDPGHALGQAAFVLAQANTVRVLRDSLADASGRGLVPPGPWSAPADALVGSQAQFLGLVALACVATICNYFAIFHQIAKAAHTAAALGVTTAACVNESLSVCSAVSSIGEAAGLRTVGVPTILLMDHPTCRLFPTALHLAYGTQHAQLMIRAGVEPQSIRHVGSYYFDRSTARDAQADREYTGRLLPDRDGRPLVVIATEHRPRQLLEINPTLEALARRDDLFVVVKLHPADTPELVAPALQRAGNPKHIVVVDKCDVLALLNTSDLLVTLGSNLIVEGAAMGKLSLCFNYSGAPCPIDFVADGLCLGASSPAECVEMIGLLVTDSELRRKAVGMLGNLELYNAFNDGNALERTLDCITGLN
ncbi:UDP-N-acetylglucosamine 2-epimerase [Fundidesulfovibrio agrisoli]|uniref:UDP-N-acetylglucosamine 2-epimerase n=1 Tax=Fundidesulfovibrio agrisoli TaxID=2922717 RepID=UPI001FABC7D8|nr:UDP-N-acetylglucosamine 2-epimerase [Fundidesulfovibrio agrisoli]